MITFKTFVAEASKIEVSHKDVMRVLTGLDKSIVDKPLTRNKLKSLFDKAINTIVEADVTVNTSPAVSHNTMNITAYFDDQAEEDYDTQFEFVLVFNPDDKSIKLSASFWKWLKTEIADAVVHEMLHRSQARSRGYDVEGTSYFKGTTKDQKYYGRPDEIEAFALNAAHEMLRKFKTTQNARKALGNVTQQTVSATIDRYLEAFQSPDHPVMKTFLKKVYTFLGSDI